MHAAPTCWKDADACALSQCGRWCPRARPPGPSMRPLPLHTPFFCLNCRAMLATASTAGSLELAAGGRKRQVSALCKRLYCHARLRQAIVPVETG